MGLSGAILVSGMPELRVVLRQLRTDARLSPEELATEADVSRSTIYRLENGEIEEPDLQTLRRIVGALGVTLSSFFAQIEGLKGPRTELQNLPSENQTRTADASTPLPTSDAALSTTDLAALITAGVSGLGESLERAIDRAADRILTAREPAATPRDRQAGESAARRPRHRKVG